METKIIDCKDIIDVDQIKEAAKAIRDGELVLFPTETVYGIGANALLGDSVRKIFEVKGRAQDNPLIVHISSVNDLDKVAEEPNSIEKKLIDEFCPGPITVILKAKKNISRVVTAGLDTVGIRIPSNSIARELIKQSKVPVAAPSANISGKPSGTDINDILNEFNGKVRYIIDNGQVDIGLESTVVRVIEDKVHILRPGKISPEDIEGIGLQVEIDKNILNMELPKGQVLSPGMKYKHYAPDTKCLLVYGKNNNKLIEKINELSKEKNVVVIGKTSNLEKYNANKKLDMGETKEEMAHNIFKLLRKVDTYKADLVIIEGVDKKGIGLALYNRLLRACEYNYIDIDNE